MYWKVHFQKLYSSKHVKERVALNYKKIERIEAAEAYLVLMVMFFNI